MTFARTWAVALTGIEGVVVEVEADLTEQLPDFRIIGLPDKALGEAAQRVRNACANSGLPLPRRRLTVNLSPASLPKHGSGFDVAVAVAALATELPLSAESLAHTAHLGELGLDGRLRVVPGILPAVRAAAASGLRRAIVPFPALAEASLVAGIEVLGAWWLTDVVRAHGLEVEERAAPTATDEIEDMPDPGALELAEIESQEDAVDALIVAAAGGHHLLMTGPPGAGKTMLAERMPGILPELDDEAALTVAAVQSLSGRPVRRLPRTPPFEAPHHSASATALIGGGSRSPRPGAIVRASEGVLFLDEAAEFPSHTLDTLRQPLEKGAVTVHRAGYVAQFPARFQLIMATNPCPCGNRGIPGAVCECPPQAVRRYQGRLSGPLLDRVDIEVTMTRVSRIPGIGAARVSTAEARARVAAARERAKHRLADTPWDRNAAVPGSWLRHGPCAPEARVRAPLDTALARGQLTLRGYDRTLRVAWSVADLEGADALSLAHVGRALFLKRGFVA